MSNKKSRLVVHPCKVSSCEDVIHLDFSAFSHTIEINMLEYQNILTSKDKEVRDPVSGYSYPISVNDMHAERAQVEQRKQDSNLASMLSSMIK